jgi:hypothetical protein
LTKERNGEEKLFPGKILHFDDCLEVWIIYCQVLGDVFKQWRCSTLVIHFMGSAYCGQVVPVDDTYIKEAPGERATWKLTKSGSDLEVLILEKL